MKLSARIKFLREQANMTQLELAQILHISNSTLSQYESGGRTPSDDVKIRIADQFSVSLDYLLGRTDEKEPPTPVTGDGRDEKDIRLANWFRSLPPDKKKAILTLGEAPADLDE